MTLNRSSELDESYMRQCIELAREASRLGETPVGSVIVRGEHIVAHAYERTKARFDVTAHAEQQPLVFGRHADVQSLDAVPRDFHAVRERVHLYRHEMREGARR